VLAVGPAILHSVHATRQEAIGDNGKPLTHPSMIGAPMYTMILLLYLQSGLDVTLDQASLRGEFRSKGSCEAAADKLRGPIPIPRHVQAAWQDVLCIKLNPNVSVNQMKPIELGKLLQQNPPLGCQAEGAWSRVAEMCVAGEKEQGAPAPAGERGGKR
jgi:hypothetical protein